jgi:hypothetical protein
VDLFVRGSSLLAVLLTNTRFGLAPCFLSRAPRSPTGVERSNRGCFGRQIAHTIGKYLLVALQLGLSLALLVGEGLFWQNSVCAALAQLGLRCGTLITFALDPRLSSHTVQIFERRGRYG